METRQLRYFARVAEFGSFSRAADDLKIAQSAVSHQILALEHELKVTLLDRHSRGVTLTPAGALLLKHVVAIFDQFDSIRSEIRAMGQYPSGEVSFVALPSIAQLLAPVLLRRFRDEHPQVRLVIREGLPVQIQEWILHGRTDMGIQYSVNQTGAIAGVSLVREQLHLIGSSRLPRLPVGGIRVQRLGQFPLVLTSTWHVIRRDLERAFAEHDVRSNVLAEVDSVAVVKELVRHGFAYGILPKWAVFQEVQQKQLVAVPIHGFSGWTELMLMWLKTRTLSPAACELRNVVLEETAKLCELGWGQSVK